MPRTPAGRAKSRSGELHLTAHDGASQRSPARGKLEFAWELPEGSLREAVGRVVAVRRLLPRVETRVRVTPLELGPPVGFPVQFRVRVPRIEAKPAEAGDSK